VKRNVLSLLLKILMLLQREAVSSDAVFIGYHVVLVSNTCFKELRCPDGLELLRYPKRKQLEFIPPAFAPSETNVACIWARIK